MTLVGEVAEARPEVVGPTRSTRIARAIAAGVLVGLWAVFIWMSYVAAPRPASTDELRSAAQFGHVEGWVAVQQEPKGSMQHRWWNDDIVSELSPADDGAFIVWRDEAGNHVTEFSDVAERKRVLAHTPPLTGQSPLDIIRTATTAGVWLGPIALLVMIFGHRPRHGTRWYWFWVFGLPLGIGVVAYAAAELVRSRPSSRHRDGSEGFGVLILGTVALYVLAAGLTTLS